MKYQLPALLTFLLINHGIYLLKKLKVESQMDLIKANNEFVDTEPFAEAGLRYTYYCPNENECDESYWNKR